MINFINTNLKITSGSKEPKENIDIWFKHGKNLYMGQAIKNGRWFGTGVIGYNGSGWYVVVPIDGGKTYTISRKNGKSESSQLSLLVATTEQPPDTNVSIVDGNETDSANGKKVTIQTSTNANYLFIGVAAGNTTVVTEEIQALALEELQVEVGEVATEYEKYIVEDIIVREQNAFESLFKNKTIINETDVDTNIRTKVEAYAKVVTIDLYTTEIKKAFAVGASNTLIATIPEIYAPKETVRKHIRTNREQGLIITVNTSGRIEITYVYNEIKATNYEQIAEVFTYIAR